MIKLSKNDREFLKNLSRHPEVPLVPHSGQIQDLWRDGYIEIRAVLTEAGRKAMKESSP